MRPIQYQKSLTGKTESQIKEFLLSKNFICYNQLNPNSTLDNLQLETQPTYYIDNLIGVRSTVAHGLGWSVVPRISVEDALDTKRLFRLFKARFVYSGCERPRLKKTAAILEQYFKKILA